MKPLLTALMLLFFFACIAQRNNDSLFFRRMPVRKISVSEKSPADTIYDLPFHNVNIWDARADTTSIGFLKTNNTTNKLVFEKKFSDLYIDYIHQHYHLNSDSNSLLILIKEFRVTKYAQSSGISRENIAEWKGGCLINAELFLSNNDNYHALYKIDTLLIESSGNETVEELVTESLKTILRKSENKNLSELHKGKTAFSRLDIQKHVDDFFNFQVLNDSILNKGVYKSFSEFKFNNPSIKNYEVRKGRLSDELFVTEDNQSYPLQDFWGYCDGKNLFLRSASNLFIMIRAGNTFNIRAIKSLSKNYTKSQGYLMDATTEAVVGVPITLFMPQGYDANPTAFQLDMQTGEIY